MIKTLKSFVENPKVVELFRTMKQELWSKTTTENEEMKDATQNVHGNIEQCCQLFGDTVSEEVKENLQKLILLANEKIIFRHLKPEIGYILHLNTQVSTDL